MRFRIDIDYPPERMARSRRRHEARARFGMVDRVPVGFCLSPRFFTPLFDVPYRAFFEDAEAQFHWQLLFHKYRLENIPEDFCQQPTLTVAPYFDNVMDSDAFGARTVWPENETLHTRPTIGSVERMERFEVPEPDAGLWARAIDWWTCMKQLARATRVTFAGHEGRVEVGPLGLSGLDAHMIAVDLVGTDFYAWLLECPDACHRFLDKITRGLIRTLRRFMDLDPRPRTALALAADTATAMSADHFRQFVVPYDHRLYEAFGFHTGGRHLHMCGPSTHLHEALVQDLRISSFDLFGFQVPPDVAAANLGGRMLLWGNIDPMLMRSGTRDEVKRACAQALAALAPCGGLLLGDGANVCPGTPLENLAVFVGAAEEYASEVADEARSSHDHED